MINTYMVHKCDVNDNPKGGNLVEVVLYPDHIEDVSDQLSGWFVVIAEQKEEIERLEGIADHYHAMASNLREALLKIYNFKYTDDNIFDAEQILHDIAKKALEVQP